MNTNQEGYFGPFGGCFSPENLAAEMRRMAEGVPPFESGTGVFAGTFLHSQTLPGPPYARYVCQGTDGSNGQCANLFKTRRFKPHRRA